MHFWLQYMFKDGSKAQRNQIVSMKTIETVHSKDILCSKKALTNDCKN